MRVLQLFMELDINLFLFMAMANKHTVNYCQSRFKVIYTVFFHNFTSKDIHTYIATYVLASLQFQKLS